MYSSLPLSFSGSGSSSGAGSYKIGQFTLDTPTDKTYAAISYATFAGVITGVYGLKTSSGTLTLAIKINGTNVTSLSALSVTSTPQNVAATGAYTFAIGDRITFVVSASSTPTDLEGSIAITQS